MSAKLAHPGNYQLWGPEQEGFLYFVSGDASDAIYGMGCVFSVGYEIGSEFYSPCDELESEIVPIMQESLLYAAKCASAPYLLPLGPDVLSIDINSTDPSNVVMIVEVSDDALIVNHAVFDSNPGQPIAAVHVFVDSHPYDEESEGFPMEPVGELFYSVKEVAVLTLDLSYLEGRHTLYFQATDRDGFAGPVSSVFVEFQRKENKESLFNATGFNITIGNMTGADVLGNVTSQKATNFSIIGDRSNELVDAEAEPPGAISQTQFSVDIAFESSRGSKSKTSTTGGKDLPSAKDLRNSGDDATSILLTTEASSAMSTRIYTASATEVVLLFGLACMLLAL